MTPPRLTRDGSAFDQRLVRAAREDVPAEGAEERALAALGLATLAGPAVAPPAVAPPAVAPPAAATLVPALGAKLVVALLSIAAAGGAALVLVTRGAPPDAPAPRPAVLFAPPPSAPSVVVAPAPLPLSAVPSAALAPSTGLPAAPAVRGTLRDSRSPRLPPQIHDPSTLPAELTLIHQATQALATHDPASALATLSLYASRYPRGALAGEAGYLRAQALLAAGDRDGATALATRLLAADPHGVLAPKLQALIGQERIP